MTAADALLAAHDLIKKWGLYRDDYEHPVTGELDPAGALGIALFGEEHAGVWSSPDWAVQETAAWAIGVEALRALVASIGRWDLSTPEAAEMTAEDYASHIAWWLTDPCFPSDGEVLELMASVAASLTTNPIEIGAAA